MTHPDTLTIPRAVAEQALEDMVTLSNSGPVVQHAERFKAIDNLHAALQPQADTSVLQAAPWPPAGETLTEPEAMRYDFDGYGWKYIDNGSGSDWMTRHPEGEFLFTKPQALQPQAADDKIKALAAKAPKDVRIYPGGGEVIPQAASDCRTCQHLSEAWGVCEARPKCVGGEQYVYFPEKQLWDKTPRNDGQAAHQEMREALYAEFNRAVGRQHD